MTEWIPDNNPRECPRVDNCSHRPAIVLSKRGIRFILKVVANCDHLSKLKFSKELPYAFTEHGAIMAARVLNSPRAIEVSVFIVRAFVKLRLEISEHKELIRKIEQLDRRLADHDKRILSLVQAIKHLISPSPPFQKNGK